MKRSLLLHLLLLAWTVSSEVGAQPGGDRPDADVDKERRQSRGHTIGWGSDKHAPALRIKDSDRESPARLRPEWIEWRKSIGTHRTFLNSTDEELHARIYEESEIIVSENLAAFARGDVSYKLALNHFADITEEEFSHLTMRSDVLEDHRKYVAEMNVSGEYSAASMLNSLPISLDWRKWINLTAIKDQGTCNSCYAFSVIGAIEAQIYRKTLRTIDLSEQYVMDCTRSVEGNMNQGCGGGWMDVIYRWLLANDRGLRTTADIGYKGSKGDCPAANASKEIKLKGFVPVRETEDDLKIALQQGPVTVAMVAYNFHLYSWGIYDNPECRYYPDGSALHAMVAVGYGHDMPKEYWILRNSFGKKWGENGYMRMRRGVRMCHIPITPSYPILW